MAKEGGVEGVKGNMNLHEYLLGHNKVVGGEQDRTTKEELILREKDHILRVMQSEEFDPKQFAALLKDYSSGDLNEPNSIGDFGGKTLLTYAVALGRFEVVEALLRNDSIDPNRKDVHRRTPLGYAIKYRYPDIIQSLSIHAQIKLDEPVSHNADHSEYGYAPLLYAAKKGDIDTVRLLVTTQKDNPNIVSKEGGWTALMLAAFEKKEEVVDFLLKNDADPAQESEGGSTALTLAVGELVEDKRYNTIVDKLLDNFKPSEIISELKFLKKRGMSDKEGCLVESVRQKMASIKERATDEEAYGLEGLVKEPRGR